MSLNANGFIQKLNTVADKLGLETGDTSMLLHHLEYIYIYKNASGPKGNPSREYAELHKDYAELHAEEIQNILDKSKNKALPKAVAFIKQLGNNAYPEITELLDFQMIHSRVQEIELREQLAEVTRVNPYKVQHLISLVEAELIQPSA